MQKPTATALLVSLLMAVFATAHAEAPLPGVAATAATCPLAADTVVLPSIVKAILANKTLAKSQFETEADYERRIAPIVAKLSPVRITFGLSKNDVDYDAEHGTFSIAPYNLDNHIDLLEGFLTLDAGRYWFGRRIGGFDLPVRHFTAQNVYGAKFKVSVIHHTIVEYIFAGAHLQKQPNTYITFKSPQPDPRLTMLRVVIEGDVVAPYFIEDDRHEDADFRDRRDITVKLIGIPIAPKCGSVIDVMSGKVVATFDAAQLSPWYAPK